MSTTNEKLDERNDACVENAAAPPSAAEDSIADWKTKVEKLEETLLRARADFQNAQKRATAERLDAVRYANAELMKSLIKVLDDFDRALASADESAGESSLLAGVRLVRENFMKALADHGLETIDALHQAFDPAIHEALMQQPTDVHPPGTVVEQAARGYRLCGRVVRPAKVIVSKTLDSPTEGAGD